jgi:hypothetical protein
VGVGAAEAQAGRARLKRFRARLAAPGESRYISRMFPLQQIVLFGVALFAATASLLLGRLLLRGRAR